MHGGINTSTSTNGEIYNGNTLKFGIWTHLASTYDGTTYRFYVNGVLAGYKTADTVALDLIQFQLDHLELEQEELRVAQHIFLMELLMKSEFGIMPNPDTN